MFEEKNKSN